MSIETKFDIPFVAAMAFREKQMQQRYRPIVGVHKWFARRPGTLFRALLLCEFGDGPLERLFFRAHDFPGRTVADPFMGGGTPLIEANRAGCDVIGCDVHPLAAWIVREALEPLDLDAYATAAQQLRQSLQAQIDRYYRTDCPRYGDRDLPVKYFLWVKTVACQACGGRVDLFPSYRIAVDTRHPRHVLVCPGCGELSEVNDPHRAGACGACDTPLRLKGPASRGGCPCPRCRHENRYPRPAAGPPRHRLFAIEYHNPQRQANHRGRFFKRPDARDLARLAAAEAHRQRLRAEFVPSEAIPSGEETDRLRRWGYRRYRKLFNGRQLLGLELSCRLIARVRNRRVRQALATNLSDLLRYQNLLCRYDPVALKSLDAFSIHGFPVGLIGCEANLPGILGAQGRPVGSGGWPNVVAKYARAKRYAGAPFETRCRGKRNERVAITGEWLGEGRRGARPRRVHLRCADSRRFTLPPASVDAVFTDPPYWGNVQYGELMDFCRVWLRRLVGPETPGLDGRTGRRAGELGSSARQPGDLERYAEGLAAVYRAMVRALKPGAPLAFTFHHNRPEAYAAVGVALLDAGLTCSATFPCPAETEGSIHIRGTRSAIVDTVFVCRTRGTTRRWWLCQTAAQLAALVGEDLAGLRRGGVRRTEGDARCILYGHLTRLAVWHLRSGWEGRRPTAEKIAGLGQALRRFGEPDWILARIAAGRATPRTSGSRPTGGRDEAVVF